MHNNLSLPEAIQRISPDPITEMEALEASRNFAGFFALLIDIDRKQSAPQTARGRV